VPSGTRNSVERALHLNIAAADVTGARRRRAGRDKPCPYNVAELSIECRAPQEVTNASPDLLRAIGLQMKGAHEDIATHYEDSQLLLAVAALL
jgi:hypothetical protein